MNAFRKIRLKDLVQYAHETEASTDEVVPITLQRAVSQTKNPRALPEDIVLTISFDEKDQINGYIGALPETIGETRCAWNSCWWVKPGSPSEVSLRLLFSFLSDWNHKILFSELTPVTTVLIEKLNFCKLHYVIGFRGYYRFCLAEIMPRKKPVLHRVEGLLKAIDCFVNFLIEPVYLLRKKKKNKNSGIAFQVIDFPLPEDDPFLEKMNQGNPVQRTSADFRWIAQNRWIVDPSAANQEVSKRYYFSYSLKRFETKWIRFSMSGRTVGLVAYTIRDKHLKLPYVFLEPEAEKFIGDYFLQLLYSDRTICSITTFHAGLSNYFARKKQAVFSTHLPKMTAQSNQLIEEARSGEFIFQMGDGDCIFT